MGPPPLGPNLMTRRQNWWWIQEETDTCLFRAMWYSNNINLSIYQRSVFDLSKKFRLWTIIILFQKLIFSKNLFDNEFLSKKIHLITIQNFYFWNKILFDNDTKFFSLVWPASGQREDGSNSRQQADGGSKRQAMAGGGGRRRRN